MWLQIRFANPVGVLPRCGSTPILEPSMAANPVHKSGLQCGCKSGTQIRWVLPRCGSTPNRGQSPSHKSITQYGRLFDGYREQSTSHKPIAQYGRPHVENSGHDPSHLSIRSCLQPSITHETVTILRRMFVSAIAEHFMRSKHCLNIS
jgi:hypothetical protein